MGVLRVKTTYRAGAARLRRKIGDLPGRWPNYSLNNSDKQVHLITAKAVFPLMAPLPLHSIHDLASFDAPPPPRKVEERLMNTEENSFWPIDVRPYSSYEEKQRDCYEFYQETLKASRSQVDSEVIENNSDKKIFWGANILSAGGGLMIFGQFAVSNFGGGIQNLVSAFTGG